MNSIITSFQCTSEASPLSIWSFEGAPRPSKCHCNTAEKLVITGLLKGAEGAPLAPHMLGFCCKEAHLWRLLPWKKPEGGRLLINNPQYGTPWPAPCQVQHNDCSLILGATLPLLLLLCILSVLHGTNVMPVVWCHSPTQAMHSICAGKQSDPCDLCDLDPSNMHAQKAARAVDVGTGTALAA